MCLTKSAFDGRLYLPKDCFDKIHKREIIRYELKRAHVDDAMIDHLEDYIFEKAGLVFLILVKLGWTSRIVDIQKNGFTNAHLPIIVDRSRSDPYEAMVRANSELSHHHYLYGISADVKDQQSVERTFNEGKWAEDDSDLDDFAAMQWSFFPAILERNTDSEEFLSHRDLGAHTLWSRITGMKRYNDGSQYFEADTIIPIVSTSEEMRGGFSKVTKVLFHPMHISPAFQQNQAMALKESTYDIDKEASDADIQKMFQNEIRLLKMMRKLDHEHVIKFVTNFSFPTKTFIVFPWAKAGNLRDFWTREGSRDADPEYVAWFLDQLRGIFDGINQMHSQKCIHGDIKPENLLLFPKDGNLPRIVIADFGLAVAHTNPTVLRRANNQFTKTVWRTPKYEAPDFEDQESKGLVVRSKTFDIWQMGCVTLEFLIWLLWGHTKGLLVFHDEFPNGKFWKISSETTSLSGLHGKRVHPAVSKTIQWMQRQYSGWGKNTLIGDILSLVRDKLLVVETNCENGRAESKVVLEEVDRICKEVGMEASYLEDCARAPQVAFLSTSAVP